MKPLRPLPFRQRIQQCFQLRDAVDHVVGVRREVVAAAGSRQHADQEPAAGAAAHLEVVAARSEEHTSELQSLMRISYAVFCLKKKKRTTSHILTHHAYNHEHSI